MNYKGFDVQIEIKQYKNGGDAIYLIDKNDHSPVAVATSWIEGLQPGELAIKDYSENEGMYRWLVDNNVVTPSVKMLYGFPICKLVNN